jgi:serine/threonine protein kinase
MLDYFQLEGPNGTHSCAVLELLGPSVPDLLDARFRGERLPGKLAKSISKQALLGLDVLHQHKIGHGGELAFFNFLADLSHVYIRLAYSQHSFHYPCYTFPM